MLRRRTRVFTTEAQRTTEEDGGIVLKRISVLLHAPLCLCGEYTCAMEHKPNCLRRDDIDAHPAATSSAPKISCDVDARVYSPQRHRGRRRRTEIFFKNNSSVLLRAPLCLCGEYTCAMERGPCHLRLTNFMRTSPHDASTPSIASGSLHSSRANAVSRCRHSRRIRGRA